MYPAVFFALFPPFPRENKVFVAMSFAEEFRQRWKQVIEPAVREIGLDPHRVDVSKISDSILTHILNGIATSRLILADVSADAKGIRNGNVMYEVGIAHATRQPQEVVLFRSDQEKLLFDLANIRVNSYDPDSHPDVAKQVVKEALSEALHEIDVTKNLAVKRAVEALDQVSFRILATAIAQGTVKHPQLRTMGQILGSMADVQALSRLLELGLITTRYVKLPLGALDQLSDEEVLNKLVYLPTPLGKAVVEEIGSRFGNP